jgi:hypothetical protein
MNAAEICRLLAARPPTPKLSPNGDKLMKNPFLYDLAKSSPATKKLGGTVQLAY